MRKKSEDGYECIESLMKRVNIDNDVLMFNTVANVLSNCLEGKMLNNMIDFVSNKQDELGRKRLNLSGVTMSDHVVIGKANVRKVTGFF